MVRITGEVFLPVVLHPHRETPIMMASLLTDGREGHLPHLSGQEWIETLLLHLEPSNKVHRPEEAEATTQVEEADSMECHPDQRRCYLEIEVGDLEVVAAAAVEEVDIEAVVVDLRNASIDRGTEISCRCFRASLNSSAIHSALYRSIMLPESELSQQKATDFLSHQSRSARDRRTYGLVANACCLIDFLLLSLPVRILDFLSA